MDACDFVPLLTERSNAVNRHVAVDSSHESPRGRFFVSFVAWRLPAVSVFIA
jgi:hypothetical protein